MRISEHFKYRLLLLAFLFFNMTLDRPSSVQNAENSCLRQTTVEEYFRVVPKKVLESCQTHREMITGSYILIQWVNTAC